MKTLLISLLLISPTIYASEELAKKNNCMACHQAERKVVGPAYKEIADKYRNQAGATDYLAKKIRSGGKGVWGQMPMPAQSHVSEANSQEIAKWILTK